MHVYKRNRKVKGRNKIHDSYSPEKNVILDYNKDQHIHLTEPADGFGNAKWVNRAEIRELLYFVCRLCVNCKFELI